MKKPKSDTYSVGAEVYVDLEASLIIGAPSAETRSLSVDATTATGFRNFMVGLTEFDDRVHVGKIITKRPPTRYHKAKMHDLITSTGLQHWWPSSKSINFGDHHKPYWWLDEGSKAREVVEASKECVVGVVDPNIAELGGTILSAAVACEVPLQPIVVGAVEHASTSSLMQSLVDFAQDHMPEVEIEQSDLHELGSSIVFTSTSPASFTIEVVRLGGFSQESGNKFAEALDSYCF